MFDANKGFISCIIGKRGSGKSYLLLQMLLHKRLLRDKFDEIILINPSYEYDDKYHNIEFDEVYTEYTMDLIEDLNDKFKEDPNIKRLLILDDCISSNEFKSNNSYNPLNTLVSNGRHWGCSLIVLSQKYNAISKIIRSQYDYVIFFSIKNHKELSDIYDEYGIGNKEEFINTVSDIFSKPYNFICLDVSNDRILKNFNSI
jgi:energy-coupling factor transporter ATP-binding protein EcfA2